MPLHLLMLVVITKALPFGAAFPSEISLMRINDDILMSSELNRSSNIITVASTYKARAIDCDRVSECIIIPRKERIFLLIILCFCPPLS